MAVNMKTPDQNTWSPLCFHILTQVIMEKKEKAIAARAASAPWLSGSSSAVVRDH